jgi:8-oxo-dGTP pyrophosphatase MutT (NUDIX family)
MPLHWDLPGGAMEAGETAPIAAIREAREETSLRVIDLVPITTVMTKGGPHHIFYATRWSGRVKIDFEHVAFSWVKRQELDQWDIVPPQRETLFKMRKARI